MSDASAAPPLRRLVATAIDFVVVPVVSIGVMLVSGAMESAEAYAGFQPILRPILLGIAGYLLVNGWLLYRHGQTLGKRIMGLAIVRQSDGSKASLGRLVGVRALFFPLLYLPIGFAAIGAWALLPVVDNASILLRGRRCLHDFAAGTRVVRTRR